MSARRRLPGRTAVRDTISFILGWYLMIYQAQFAEQFQLPVFLGGMVISGIPGALQALPLLLGRMPEPLPPSPAEPSSVEQSP